MSRLTRPLVVVWVATACGGDASSNVGFHDPSDAADAVATITAADIEAQVGVLAHDSMRGRATPSPELDATAAWIAERFASLGLEPTFGSDYVQPYAIRTVQVARRGTWATAGGPDTLRLPADLALPFGPPPGDASSEGDVFVLDLSDGVASDLARYTGRHVVLRMARDADVRTANGFAVMGSLARSGALAVWIVSENESSASVWRREAELQGRQVRTVLGEGEDGVPVVQVRRTALGRLLAEWGYSGPFDGSVTAGLLPRARLTLNTQLDVIEAERAPNVAATLRGGHPDLASEYLVYSAHMDHVGVGRPDSRGDSIYNGADDDASGTSAVLEIAEAFAALKTPPDRSVIFLLVSGEERGLWGSQYFADHPPVPVEAMVANLNADMVGRNWSDTIVAIGKEHSELGPMLERVNERHPELGMTAIDDLWPSENFYGRSDHYNFARKGVPILFFFNGTHEDYHEPSDEVDRIDAEKTARIARLMFRLGLDVTDRPERPAWRPSSRRQIVEGAGG